MLKNFFFANHSWLPNCSLNLLRIMVNTEIVCKFQRSRLWRKIKKTAGEIDHITIRLAAEAVKSLVHFHARILIVMKRALAHAPVTHLQAVALCSLKRGHIGFYCFIKRHSHHRSCSGFFFSACAEG